ncbi:MAG: hypothetical protein K9M56_00110 [Victivallales bacterium]|nr:hypothetical protein [Victivallales bacterium]
MVEWIKKTTAVVILTLLAFNIQLFSGEKKELEGLVTQFTNKPGDGSLGTTSYLKYVSDAGSWILWVKQPGIFVKEGTKLVHADTTYIDINIRVCKAKLNAQKVVLEYAKNDMNRQRKLALKKTVSTKEYELAKINYYEKKVLYEQAKQALENALWDKKFADIPAPYDCYIEEVYTQPGTISDIDYPIMKLLRISPLAVDLKVNRVLAKKIYNNKVGVSVYPMGQNEPVGIYNEKVVLTNKGIRLPVANHILDNVKENLPVINRVSYVADFHVVDPNNAGLGILNHSFYEDNKGTYVWKAIGQKTLVPGKTIDNTFTVKKNICKKDR